ncbi:MAG: adenylosuccinate synthetase [Rhodospirillales bacterium]|nr:adenylosuccinate synthetase [Rhodospirillales bacterium]
MPVTVVVGGQFGSEGKGKVACELARRDRASVAVRIGGSNSGHTVVDDQGRTRIFRHLPTAAVLPDTICVIGPGSYLDVDVLLREISGTCLTPARLLIDPNAVIISEAHKEAERQREGARPISSTCSGTGAAVADRVLRAPNVPFASSEPRLQPFVQPTQPFLRQRLTSGERVIIEGTQGFGLSPLHSPFFPHVTSRDTTAAAFVSEAGLSPLDVDEVVLVIRAFPIRVAGAEAGPMPQEIDWDTVTRESGSSTPIVEKTSVTAQIRRVARFDAEIVKRAIRTNAPSLICFNHLDYVDVRCRHHLLTSRALPLLHDVERQIGRAVDFIGTGADTLSLRRSLPVADSDRHATPISA